MKPKKPCLTCGHAKTHHSYSMISTPNGRNISIISIMPCQDCNCTRYYYHLDEQSEVSRPFEIDYTAGIITLKIQTGIRDVPVVKGNVIGYET